MDPFYTALLACLDTNGICCGQTGSAQQILAAAFDPATCSFRTNLSPLIPVTLTPSINTITGAGSTIIGPFRSLSVTTLTTGVSIDTGGGPQLVPSGFNWNIGSNDSEGYPGNVDITVSGAGDSYIYTVVT